MIKKIILALAILLLFTLIFYWKIVSYGIQQAKGQLAIIFNTEPIEKILSDSLVSDSIKNKIKIIQEARNFAFDALNLEKSSNYTSYYDQKDKVVLWNVSASAPYSLTPKLWSFPFLGSFPYKGFFELEQATAEMETLKKEGLDVRIRPVGGWSTLGWTKDPILSNMLKRGEGNLIELIIHELTHNTLFIKDDIKFNENIASFIGKKGAILFLNEKYGTNSEPYFEYLFSEEDSRIFRNQMLMGAKKLDSLYTAIENEPDSVKALKKQLIIDEIIHSIDTLHFHNQKYYALFNTSRPNNAYFTAYQRYYSAKDSLQNILERKYQNNLSLFIRGMNDFHK